MFMVLIAVSNDPDSFKELIAGKMYMEKASRLPEINTRLTLELSSSVLNGTSFFSWKATHKNLCSKQIPRSI